jgi:hypothetical protein
MVVHYPRERLRYNSERPTAICDVLLATGPRSYRSGDISFGTPTTSARTPRGLWALYPVGEEVVVAHPGGAIAGPPRQVAAALDRLAVNGRDPLERQVVQAFRHFLPGDQAEAPEGVRRPSQPRSRLRAIPGDGRLRPTQPEAIPAPAQRPAA